MGRIWGLLVFRTTRTTLWLQDLFLHLYSSLVTLLRTFIDVLGSGPWTSLMVRKKELRLGARVYDSWKLQGDVEELWDELAKLGLGLRCCFALVVPRLRKEVKQLRDQIIDFLKASSVHYALTVNPTIYTSCIEQFWAIAKVKTVNDVRQIQALIDKKKLIIMETSIRSDLHLEDAGGTDCLPTATIFKELARMGTKSTAWNEFSSIMASLIICLATNQKFNLSKYIFDAMVKHLDRGVKFLMYPRFLQVFINQQLGDMSHHKKIYVNPSHTKKIFANMKREEKDFSGRITPLFDIMLVQASKEVGEDSDHPTDSNQIPIVDQPSTSSPPTKKQKSKRKQRKEA
ncbi:hypothetical protein Tco_0168874 [Tanacetum coccineum]